MQAKVLKENYILYLFAIKQAFERNALSVGDSDTLKEIFKHSLLYRAILDVENICDVSVIAKITDFCNLIEDGLPPPEIAVGSVLHLTLVKEYGNLSVLSLPENIRTRAVELFQAVIIELMGVFQLAILDLVVKQKGESLSVADVDNTNYVIGMAEITAINYGKIIGNEYDFGDFNCGKIQKFFTDSVGFAGSLRAEKLGMAA
ncbi:hypothetical protein [Janthinobacterium sp. CAN_S7]|uniref:hypothetical protein n=1 Tax=Janthinobacterium sp. CAN_S7 TaxID=3071704 RepID=UPI00319E375A